MILDYLRLAGATALVLAPGALVGRALGQRSLAAVLAWTLASAFAAWRIVFAVHGGGWLAVAVLAVVAVAATPLAVRRKRARGAVAQETDADPPWAAVAVLVAGVVLGLLLWRVAGVVSGDGLFHLGRVRKLAELGDLHLGTV